MKLAGKLKQPTAAMRVRFETQQGDDDPKLDSNKSVVVSVNVIWVSSLRQAEEWLP